MRTLFKAALDGIQYNSSEKINCYNYCILRLFYSCFNVAGGIQKWKENIFCPKPFYLNLFPFVQRSCLLWMDFKFPPKVRENNWLSLAMSFGKEWGLHWLHYETLRFSFHMTGLNHNNNYNYQKIFLGHVHTLNWNNSDINSNQIMLVYVGWFYEVNSQNRRNVYLEDVMMSRKHCPCIVRSFPYKYVRP